MNTIKSSEHLKKKKRVEAGTALKTCLFFNFFSFVLLLSVRSFRARNGFDWSNPFCWGGEGAKPVSFGFSGGVSSTRVTRAEEISTEFPDWSRVYPSFTGFY